MTSTCSVSAASAFSNRGGLDNLTDSTSSREDDVMAKPHRTHKKANHGKRPANARARRAKRRKVRT